MSVQVKIVTPAKIAFEGEAEEVQIPGWNGEYGVLEAHANMLTLSRPGVIKLHRSGDIEQILVGKGFAEIGPKQINLLVDLCQDISDIDKQAAQTDLDNALKELEALSPMDSVLTLPLGSPK